LSIQNLVIRNTGSALSGNRIKRLTVTEVDELLPQAELALAVKSNLAVLQCLEEQIESIEAVVLAQLKLREGFAPLLTVSGIGQILGMTIMLETGEISRFATVGDFASYCRCVGSQKLSNGKRKGQGNTKNGNKYLAWAFVEAAHFAIRYNAQIKRFYQRKQAKTNGIVAVKAVAHKLARACYYILRDQVPFEVTKAFT
jgi:transposase